MNKPKYGGLDYPIGCKVIIKSNEPTYYQVGILKRVDIVGSDRTELPIVEVGGVEYGVMGIVRNYDERRTRALDKLTPDEQWNVMAEFHMVGTSTCGRCEDYHNMGLSDTCPSCDMIGELYQKAQPTSSSTPPSGQEWTSIEIFRRVKSGDDIGLPEDFVSLNAYKKLERELTEAQEQLGEMNVELEEQHRLNDIGQRQFDYVNRELAQAHEQHRVDCGHYAELNNELKQQLTEAREELKDHIVATTRIAHEMDKQLADEKQVHEATKLELAGYRLGSAVEAKLHDEQRARAVAAEEREAKLETELAEARKSLEHETQQRDRWAQLFLNEEVELNQVRNAAKLEFDGLNSEIRRLFSKVKSGEKREVKLVEALEHYADPVCTSMRCNCPNCNNEHVARKALEQHRKARGSGGVE